MNAAEVNVRSGQVVDAAMQVHTVLGPGVLEGAYQACLAHELRSRGLHVLVEVPLPVVYRGVRIELGYRVDLIVDRVVIVEVKAVAKLIAVHEAQLLSYLRMSGHRLGLLINFRVVHLKDGIRRVVNAL